MPIVIDCSTYCFVVGEGRDIINMTQDAKLVHMLNLVFSRRRGVQLFNNDSTCQLRSYVEGTVCVCGG